MIAILAPVLNCRGRFWRRRSHRNIWVRGYLVCSPQDALNSRLVAGAITLLVSRCNRTFDSLSNWRSQGLQMGVCIGHSPP